MPTWLINFPHITDIDFAGYIDQFVYYLSDDWGNVFDFIKAILLFVVSNIQKGLDLLPWWVLILIVIYAGKKLIGSYKSGIIFGVMFFFVGIFGYWDMMNETLAIVISAVLISLAIGLPIGIFLANSTDKYIRPILDAMQTMPTFVYMIPAVMLLGPGKVPAILATVVYAVVPVIRLTAHGIRQVDVEIVEAAKAFGSSKWQILKKVQIPQALPTIMTGVNQTMMMAVAMVVTCSMIGANGLGMEVLIAINRTESGRGLIAGVCIVIIAIIIDRLTQSFSQGRGSK